MNIPNYKSILSDRTLKLSNKAVIELLIEQSCMGIHDVYVLIDLLSIKHWEMHQCGAIVLVCLANNWPWPDHSNIASFGPVLELIMLIKLHGKNSKMRFR